MVKSDKLITTFPAYPPLYVNELTGKKIAILGSGKRKDRQSDNRDRYREAETETRAEEHVETDRDRDGRT